MRLISRFRVVFGAVVLAVVLVATVAASAGGGGWYTFGNGWAVNRGGGAGSPDIDLSSVSKRNPTQVRYVITNAAASVRRVHVFWDLECWRTGRFGFNERLIDRSGSYSANIRARSTLTRTFNARGEFCELDVWVDYDFSNFGDPGRLALRFQGR